jgi:peroxiredoxin
MSTIQTFPETRQMVPDFVLPSTDGREIEISNFRGRRNLVLVFIGGDGGVNQLLAGLAQRREELDEEESVVFVVFRGEPAASWRQHDGAPFTVLADQDGAVHRRFGALDDQGGSASAVYLTDRYGEIYSTCRTLAGETLPSAADVLASLRHINAACPE